MLLLWSIFAFVTLHEARFPGLFMTGPQEKIYTYPLALLIFFSFMQLRPCKVPVVLYSFGDISYSLYLLHFPVGFFVLNYLAPKFGFSISFFLACSVSVFFAWISYQIIELPFRKFARDLLRLRPLLNLARF